MEYANIPNLDKKASRIAIGTWNWEIGYGQYDEKRMIETIHRALDVGVNCIDTAPLYGKGQCEEIVGKAIKEYGKRDKVVLCTKVGLSWDDLQPVDSIHRPIKSICTRRRLHIRRNDQVFVINHYLGTREQYFYRKDARADNERSGKVRRQKRSK